MDLVSISIPNWEKYNARSDRANFTWLRFQNGFFQDHKLFGLTDSQVVLFIMCLCEASKSNNPTVDVNLEYLAAIRRTTALAVADDLAELVDRGVLLTADRHQMVAGGHHLVESLPATNVRTNETHERDGQAAAARHRDPNTEIASLDDLNRKIPILTRAKWAKEYPDPGWLSDQIARCYEFHSADPAARPRTSGAWMKKLISWLVRGWPDHQKEKGANPSVDAAILAKWGKPRENGA